MESLSTEFLIALGEFMQELDTMATATSELIEAAQIQINTTITIREVD